MQKKLEDLKRKIEIAEGRHDLATVADLRYGAVPELEKKIATLSKERSEHEV